MERAQTIQIYLPSGNPAGMRIASLTTRTVRVFEVPRSLLSEFLVRHESSQVGVYYLLSTEGDETARCYIGQSGNVGSRIQQHAVSRDFWTKALVAVSLTNEWTSTHVAFLEWLSIKQASAADRYQLLNSNQASNPHTPEPLEADCHEFLQTIQVLTATLGAPILEPVQRNASATTTSNTEGIDQELLYFRENGCDATGYQTPEGLLVLSGSRGRSGLRPSASSSTARKRESLAAEGFVTLDSDGLVFLRNHLFASPSAAASILNGGNTNGRTHWRNARGRTLNEIETLALKFTSSEAAATTSVVDLLLD